MTIEVTILQWRRLVDEKHVTYRRTKKEIATALWEVCSSALQQLSLEPFLRDFPVKFSLLNTC